MSIIWKFPLDLYGQDGNVTDRPTVVMPRGARILTLRMQHNTPTLWAIVDDQEPKVRRQFAVVGTGQPMPDGVIDYVGTWLTDDTHFVFHVFEIGEATDA